MAVWSGGKFFEGIIAEDRGDGVYLVKWNDGSSPSEVVSWKILTLADEETSDTPDETVEKDLSVKEGDSVAAPWGAGMYLGTVEAVKDDKADVLYADDKQVREIDISELVLIKERKWKEGDIVSAVWSSGKFFEGIIEEDKGDGVYLVKWDDGSEPSEVEAGKIYSLSVVEEPVLEKVSFKKGDSVAVSWDDDGIYLATVEEIDGDTAQVFDIYDEEVREVSISELVAVPQRKWKKGDRVLAVWSVGRFYEGTVQEEKSDGVYIVKWDDGSSPSEAEYIIPLSE